MSYSMNMNTNIFEKNISKDELKYKLCQMCDSSYIGENGKDFFVKDKNKKLVSMFEKKWDTIKDKSIIEIIEVILQDFYDSDKEYYINPTIKILQVSDKIVVCTAYNYELF